MCWTRTGVRIPPVNNPSRLFNALFAQSPQAVRNAERERMTHRSSVLDALLGFLPNPCMVTSTLPTATNWISI